MKTTDKIMQRTNELVINKIEEIETEKNQLWVSLDTFIDIMSATKEDISRNVDSFCEMLTDVENNEGYLDPEVVKQVIVVSSKFKLKINDIYSNLLKKATDEKYTR